MNIPTYEEVEFKADTGQELNPLERFILENEPYPPKDQEFRKELQELVTWIQTQPRE